MKRFIYADNAATTKLNNDAFEAMVPWLTEEYGNASQPYSFARNPKKALSDARATIAKCINASPNEIYFTSGGTESDNWAIKGSAFGSTPDCDVLTSSIEHHAILRACESIEHLGYSIKYINVTHTGIITPESLENTITDNTSIVSIMLANNEIGTIQPIKELSDIAHTHGALFHTDAVQAVGHIPIDVKTLGVDMLSASAHKFNGPKGVGFLYIKNGVSILPYANGGAQETGRRAGTENIAGIIGMATALKNNCDNLQSNIEHIGSLESMLIEKLNTSGIKFIRNGGTNTLPGLLSLSFPGFEGEALLHRLDLAGICVSTGSACNSQSTEISHVLQAINLEDNLAIGTIRISLGKNNNKEDIDYIVEVLNKIMQKQSEKARFR